MKKNKKSRHARHDHESATGLMTAWEPGAEAPAHTPLELVEALPDDDTEEPDLREAAALARTYDVFRGPKGGLVKAWVRGVPFEDAARKQVLQVAPLPFIHKWIAVMPDVHAGKGSTIGSVIPTIDAIIPAAVGVDIGCGMMAARTTLSASDLPENLHTLRTAIERAVPHGRTSNGGGHDRGAWRDPPPAVEAAWRSLEPRFREIAEKEKAVAQANTWNHLGTLGTGNHFIEVSLDEHQAVWVVLHSGSRGIGNRIGTHFIELAKREMERWHVQLPDADLAYLPQGSKHFGDYVRAVGWAQDYARLNRELMMRAILDAMAESPDLPPFRADVEVVDCHHNYVARERHFGREVWVTRKGAVRAGSGELGIIPGSMGARSFIVRGKGNRDSFCSCSHGAGRAMSRSDARRRFSLADHVRDTAEVECRKDSDVIDETPKAYKDIDAVMEAQKDLVEVVHTIKQVLCVKG